MTTNYFIATVLGWYLVIISLLLILRREVILVAMREVMAQRALLLVIASITVIIGLLMVVSHNTWIMAWPIVVTIFSWLILIGGLIRLFFPEVVLKVWGKMESQKAVHLIMGVILLLIGLFLLYKVYFGV